MLAPAGEAPSETVQGLVWLALFGLVFGGLGYALFAFVRWALFIQTVLLEGVGPANALRRSAALLRRQWWRTATLLTLLAMGQAVLASLATALVGGALASLRDDTMASLAGGL